MRQAFPVQPTFDCPLPHQVKLNLGCRDEMIPILRALQHIYSDTALLQSITTLIGKDVNHTTSKKQGRPGLSYWEILVLAAVRMGCNYNYDKLQDLAEEHRSLRLMMGIVTWEAVPQPQDKKKFDWRNIRDNLCWLRPETVKKINDAVVTAGHVLAPRAIERVRGDTFVAETNIHYPTDSSLIEDGLRKVLKLSAALAKEYEVAGWRQHDHWHKTVRKQVREIGRAAKSKKSNKDERLEKGYRELLETAKDLLGRATELLLRVALLTGSVLDELKASAQQRELKNYVELTRTVCVNARRRVLEGEAVPNDEKIFSIFETHTELIKRDKQPNPLQFGHNVLVIEDAAGFICHYEVVKNGVQDVELVVPVMKKLQKQFDHKIEYASFDRGFHSLKNQIELGKIVAHPCLAAKGSKKGQEQQENASVEFRESRQRHPGVESAIGALQAGNGLERCRDHSERGYARYVGLGILGRNLHVLGKLLIRQEAKESQAAKSKRKKVA